MDVVALQEVRWPLDGNVNKNDNTIDYSGCEEERLYGVCFLAKNKTSQFCDIF